ncbi:hypothetical protein [Dermabacter sp. HSID17554]|uniref:hypothetical protein n=1 Tax=Dermabacter sp. HSID17554 TaxID=2419511 RepID=UPI000F88213D|nr:hypothetical protein [Dermabacter sp. HSID17554]
MTPIRRASRSAHRARGERRSWTGFPPGVFAGFLAATILLGIMLSWALNLSVEMDAPAAQNVADSNPAPGTDNSGLPVLTEYTIGAEVQNLLDTGSLQTPATFDVTECLKSLSSNESVLMLEQVSWGGDENAWLLVLDEHNLTQVRREGGEVSATVVRSTCGRDADGASAPLFSARVLVDPKS